MKFVPIKIPDDGIIHTCDFDPSSWIKWLRSLEPESNSTKLVDAKPSFTIEYEDILK
jgi:hypothetical protein